MLRCDLRLESCSVCMLSASIMSPPLEIIDARCLLNHLSRPEVTSRSSKTLLKIATIIPRQVIIPSIASNFRSPTADPCADEHGRVAGSPNKVNESRYPVVVLALSRAWNALWDQLSQKHNTAHVFLAQRRRRIWHMWPRVGRNEDAEYCHGSCTAYVYMRSSAASPLLPSTLHSPCRLPSQSRPSNMRSVSCMMMSPRLQLAHSPATLCCLSHVFSFGIRSCYP